MCNVHSYEFRYSYRRSGVCTPTLSTRESVSFNGNWCYYRVWHISSKMLPDFVRKMLKMPFLVHSFFLSSSSSSHTLLSLRWEVFSAPFCRKSWALWLLDWHCTVGRNSICTQQTDCNANVSNCRRFPNMRVCQPKREREWHGAERRMKHAHKPLAIHNISIQSFWWWHQNHNRGNAGNKRWATNQDSKKRTTFAIVM